MALLDVKNLCVDFHTDQGTVHAVRDISFSVGESEAVGIVGESGSGKSVTMYSVMGLLAGNGSITGGSVSLNGQEITESAFPDHKAYEAAMDQIRGCHLSHRAFLKLYRRRRGRSAGSQEPLGGVPWHYWT